MNATAKIRKNTKIGDIIFIYEDETHHTMPLLYGENIFSFDNIRPRCREGYQLEIAWQGKAKNGEGVSVRRVTWTNPYPAKKVNSIIIRSAAATSAPILFAITGVE